MSEVTEEMVNAADSVLSRSRPGIPDDVIRLAIAAALSHSPVEQTPAQEAKTPSDFPVKYRHEDGGFVEFVNSDAPYLVRFIEAPAAILVDVETRNVIGYRVYDPDGPAPAPTPAPPVEQESGKPADPAPAHHVVGKSDLLMKAVIAARTALEPHVSRKDDELRARALLAIEAAVGPSEGMESFYEKWVREKTNG